MIYVTLAVITLWLNYVGAQNYHNRRAKGFPIIDADSFAYWYLTAIISVFSTEIIVTHLMLGG